MPIYEYKCKECDKTFEHLFKTQTNQEKITCPNCGSENLKKLFSAFAPKIKAETSASFNDFACSNGSCSKNDNGFCSSCN